MSIVHYNHRALMFSSELDIARKLTRLLDAAGLMEPDVETNRTNFLSKLRNREYVACIIDYSAMENAPELLLEGIRSNKSTSQLPIFVIAPELEGDELELLYEKGVNYVMNDLENTLEFVWVLDSLVRLIDQFRQISEKFFR